ncbi:ChbG/HpnK family deacetylase [Roseibium litorale]|uniref:ChbG/HpnK family deacetylase n=1 Tax=Roseibium litorale TaxID=2803841 RepID=A0ABR9CQ11_9HYPH|nr:ChbG/HpnK family deacetylase [Roseibium litorale]MBD8892941.1 ChbG/HpnK family deacetylase [Roseibium litorale]
MKRIVLGSLDYGLSFGVDRAVRQLLEMGHLSAAGCLVATDLWSRDYKPLKDLTPVLGNRAMIGLTIALSGDRVLPMSQRMQGLRGGVMPSRGWIARRAFVRMLPDEILIEEMRVQILAFVSRMDVEPEFIALREGLMEYREIVRLALAAVDAAGLVTRPLLIAADHDSHRFRRLKKDVALKGYGLLPRGPALPEVADTEELHRLVRGHFDGLADMTFIPCIPGEVDDRLRRDEPKPKLAVRECQRLVLSSRRFFQTLDQKDVFLN